MAYTTYNLAALGAYVRNLTGVFSTDILTDGILYGYINEAYSELSRQQEWTWSNTASPAAALASGSDVPAFNAQYHPLLAYKAAATVLVTQADDTPRAQEYLAIYKSIVLSLIQDDLQIAITGDVINTGDYTDYSKLVKFVRQLINVYDGTVSNTYIENKLKDEYKLLADAFTWSWTYGTGNLTAIAEYAKILAYSAAAKLSAELGAPEQLTKAYMLEYADILERMKRTTLYTLQTVAPSTLAQLRVYTRSLMGNYSKDIPDVLINTWLNEAYTLLQNQRDWKWLQVETSVSVTAGSSVINLPAGSTGKIMGIYVVNENGLSIDPVTQRPTLHDVDENTDKYFFSTTSAGVITIAPAPTENITVKIRYVKNGDLMSTDASTTLLDTQFVNILAYRAAIKGYLFSPDANKKILEIYVQQERDMFDAIISYYNLDHNTDTFQLGIRGVEERKYIPYFRVN